MTRRIGRSATRSGIGLSLGVLVGLLGAMTGARASDESVSVCPPAEIEEQAGAGWSVTRVPLPGRLESLALPRRGDGRHDVVLLVVPDDSLFLDPSRRAHAVNLSRKALEAIVAGRTDVQLKRKDRDALREALSATRGENGQPGCRVAVPDLAAATLFRLRAGEALALATLRPEVPTGSRAVIALDADGDEADEVYVEADGRMIRLASRAADDRAVLFDADLDLRAEAPPDVRFPEETTVLVLPFKDLEDVSPRGHRRGPALVRWALQLDPPFVRVTDLGALRLHAPGDDGTWALVAQVPLPVRSTPDPTSLLLASPQVRTVGTNPAGNVVLAAGPVPYGDRRLRTLLIEIGDPEAPAVREAWSQLPVAETVQRSGYLMLDGEPYLWVFAEQEQAIELFGNHDSFRLFRLGGDRTRAGSAPVLSVNKYEGIRSGPRLGLDVDQDGRQDLVLVGVTRGQAAFATYLQKKDGRFGTSPRYQRLDSSGSTLTYQDLDFDGRPELITASGEQVQVFAGSVDTAGGRRVVEVTPRWQVPAWGCDDAPVVDLDGDGMGELICLGSDDLGRPALEVTRFTRTATPP